MPGAHNPGGYMSSEDAAAYLGISVWTLRDWRRRGLVTYFKPGRDCMYTKEGLDMCMRAHRHPCKAEAELEEFEMEASRI